MNSAQEPIAGLVTSPRDLDPIRQIAAPLLDKICWKVTFGYGMALSLHWGPAVKYVTPLGEREKGTWILHVAGSEWTINCADGTELRSSSEQGEAWARAQILEGSATWAFEIEFPDLGLDIGFANGCRLHIDPREEGNDEGRLEGISEQEWKTIELENWVLFGPEDMYLRIGPGRKWWYGPGKMAR